MWTVQNPAFENVTFLPWKIVSASDKPMTTKEDYF